MTDWTGGPEPEYQNELDEEFGRPEQEEEPESHGWPVFPSLTEPRAT